MLCPGMQPHLCHLHRLHTLGTCATMPYDVRHKRQSAARELQQALAVCRQIFECPLRAAACLQGISCCADTFCLNMLHKG